uniref:Uncharacterized protein n=1 Tax=Rhizophora mucronata TaxID=61149 RepID=A0A2P2MAL5_RHIMU
MSSGLYILRNTILEISWLRSSVLLGIHLPIHRNFHEQDHRVQAIGQQNMEIS